MGILNKIIGLVQTADHIGGAVERVSEVFTPNQTKEMTLAYEKHRAALEQYGAEFTHQRIGLFDRAVDALNRLPRPMMALGTIGLFAFAMVAPRDFADRMYGLSFVPEPLWWLLGAIVSFYFGARELHHRRVAKWQPELARRPDWPVEEAAAREEATSGLGEASRPLLQEAPDTRYSGSENAALDAWRATKTKGNSP